VPAPDPAAPAGEFGFKFDRSGYRVPAILVSPWVEQGSVFNDEYRHSSLIATLRKSWKLGDAFTERDASARTFDHLLTLETPRDPRTWATITALPVPDWHMDEVVVGKALSTLGRAAGGALFQHAQEAGIVTSVGTHRSNQGTRTPGHHPGRQRHRRPDLPPPGHEHPRGRHVSRASGGRRGPGLLEGHSRTLAHVTVASEALHQIHERVVNFKRLTAEDDHT
jgi:hypothetical protein